MTPEHDRLEAEARRTENWKRWGPYLSERQWATVREDYSAGGNPWGYFPHDQARSRAYRWGEDGLLGFCDREARLCFALALWNERDAILKERLYGLTGPEGNHGEDCKELYYYLDSTPCHSYAKALYKYPQEAFPYQRLMEENRRRGLAGLEYELSDTGVLDQNRYFDVLAEYAKAAPEDLLIQITVANRAAQPARLHLLPTLWFRNVWSWGETHEVPSRAPQLRQVGEGLVEAEHEALGRYLFAIGAAPGQGGTEVWFTENDTNAQKLFNSPNPSPYVKDAFHRRLIQNERDAVNPAKVGTKCAPHYILQLGAGEAVTLRFRLCRRGAGESTDLGEGFAEVFRRRQAEADEFYAQLIPAAAREDERRVMRQGYAGLLWTKQFYHYIVQDWMDGDPGQPKPPAARRDGRNKEWGHLYSRDVISMPDKWEYPWFAAWDLAFHMLPFGDVDPEFTKRQLTLFLREWYMHPNGQLPAYEFNFGDVNPPVHAWAVWRVYKTTAKPGARDRVFLESAFHKLLLNFTWWVNRKDPDGNNIFAGGFLGLDNIGVFDRSKPLPTGGHLQQADGTAWMAFYAATMLSMALELAKGNAAYEDMASKFFEHFVQIVDAMTRMGGTGLWDERDGIYYDQLKLAGQVIPLRTRSLVGLLPLIAVEVLVEEEIRELPGFYKRFNWFLEHRPDLAETIGFCPSGQCGLTGRTFRLLSVPSKDRLSRMLAHLFNEAEFLSPYGVRGVSKHHEQHPYVFHANGEEFRLDYVPGEGNTYLFGGNSNWRGPIWFPINFLIVEALERYYHFYGENLKVELPTGRGRWVNLKQAAQELARRMSRIFLADSDGRRPSHGDEARYARDPHFRDLVLFYEYFHADTGRGCGASHQTGWTALVVRLLRDLAREGAPR